MQQRLHNTQRGFTLVELIVVMAVFIMVIMIASDAFNRILFSARKLIQSEESNIEGVIGLEIMRHDIEQAGYGLPWVSMDDDLALPDYAEASETDHDDYNDGVSGASRIPRAIVGGNNVGGVFLGDYLAIKATSLGTNNRSKLWTYATYSGSVGVSQPKAPHVWSGGDDYNIVSDEKVIVTRRELVTINDREVYAPKLLYGASNLLVQTFDPASLPEEVRPQNPQQKHQIYAIDPDTGRMPFNRVNFYVKPAATMPATCAPGTGVLYKSVVQQSDGKVKEVPLLDCVAAMHVAYGWDFSGQTVETWTNPSVTFGSGNTVDAGDAITDAGLLREHLKIVKVYILAQDGRRDPNYQSPASLSLWDTPSGPVTSTIGETVNLTVAQRNYRWKIYRIVARPKNLLANQ